MKRRRLLRILRFVWIAAGIGLVLWMAVGFQASGVEPGILTSGDGIEVLRSNEWLEFRPVPAAAAAGLIFLPGAMVEPEAYTPFLRRVAERGYTARLVYLPWRLAFTSDQIDQVHGTVSSILYSGGRWVLAGHSRGGMLASRYVYEREPLPAALVLIGTTHPRDQDLSALRIPVTKVYGTRDGIAPLTKVRANVSLLPASTKWVPVVGGNHVQFGYYRHQLGDYRAEISRAEQQQILVEAVVQSLDQVRGR